MKKGIPLADFWLLAVLGVVSLVVFLCWRGEAVKKTFFLEKNDAVTERSRGFANLRDREIAPLSIGQTQLKVEVVTNVESHRQGLSGRDEIGSDGMLFVFSKSGYHTFWMKDMRFDLDFVWIANNAVVAITTNASHPSSTQSELPTFSPPVPVNAMLEVPAGFAQQQGWTVGTSVEVF